MHNHLGLESCCSSVFQASHPSPAHGWIGLGVEARIFSSPPRRLLFLPHPAASLPRKCASKIVKMAKCVLGCSDMTEQKIKLHIEKALGCCKLFWTEFESKDFIRALRQHDPCLPTITIALSQRSKAAAPPHSTLALGSSCDLDRSRTHFPPYRGRTLRFFSALPGRFAP